MRDALAAATAVRRCEVSRFSAWSALLGVVCASRRGWDFRGVVGPFLACHEQQMSIRARQEGRNHTEKSGFWGGPVGCTNGYDTSPFL